MDLFDLRMTEVLIGSITTVVILTLLRIIERRMGRVFIRGAMVTEDKLQPLEARIADLTAKVATLETQANYLIEALIECRAVLEKEQSVKAYLSDRLATLQGYRNWQATIPGTSDTDPLPPGMD